MSETPPRPPSPLAFVLAAVLFGGVAAAAIFMLQPRSAVVTTTQIGAPIGGPFQLVDQTGAPRDQSLLQGKWSAVFFGFVSCPDVCPMTAQALGQAQGLLGSRAKDFQVVFISVDPARDTPAQLKAWLEVQDLPAGTVALTGTQEQVVAATKAYHAYASVTGSGDATDVQHSPAVYLMDPKGNFTTALVFNQPPDQLAAAIKAAMKGA